MGQLDISEWKYRNLYVCKFLFIEQFFCTLIKYFLQDTQGIAKATFHIISLGHRPAQIHSATSWGDVVLEVGNLGWVPKSR